MCGFIGVKGIAIRNPGPLLEVIKHRGPDDDGFFQHEDLFLGHVRLAILDPSVGGRQPMSDESGRVWVVFNGEIYNFRELRKDLEREGVRFCSQTDTEVVIYLYLRRGVDFLRHLRGMFAFALVDLDEDRILLARDRFGKKPLYYYHRANQLVFASEIKAILKVLDFKPEIDLTALRQYFSFLAALPPRTFFKDICKLEGGDYLLFEKGEVKGIRRYYDPLDVPRQAPELSSLSGTVSRQIMDSVRYRLVSDVDVGVFLSGGLDSSLLTAAYSELSPKRISTFSIGYRDYGARYDELDYAGQVASHLGTDHYPLTVSRKDFIEALDEVAYHLDEPINDPAAVPTFLLARWVRQNGIKVCLSGEGSDELFLGYSVYPAVLNYYNLKGLIAQGEGEPEVPDNGGGPSGCLKDREYLRRGQAGEEIYRTIGEYFCLDEFQKGRLLRASVPPDGAGTCLEKYRGKYAGFSQDVLKWCSYIDLKIWMPEVLMMKVDKMAMAHGIEVRAPYLDHDLVEFAFSVPSRLMMDKTLLREMAASRLPRNIVCRRKKGFSSPFMEWFYEEYGIEILETVRRVNRRLEVFHDDALNFFYEEGRQGRCKHVIWGLFVFAKWCDAYDMV